MMLASGWPLYKSHKINTSSNLLETLDRSFEAVVELIRST